MTAGGYLRTGCRWRVGRQVEKSPFLGWERESRVEWLDVAGGSSKTPQVGGDPDEQVFRVDSEWRNRKKTETPGDTGKDKNNSR